MEVFLYFFTIITFKGSKQLKFLFLAWIILLLSFFGVSIYLGVYVCLWVCNKSTLLHFNHHSHWVIWWENT